MVGLDCKVEGCETLGTGSEGIGGCGPWPKFGQKKCGGVRGRRGPKGKGG